MSEEQRGGVMNALMSEFGVQKYKDEDEGGLSNVCSIVLVCLLLCVIG